MNRTFLGAAAALVCAALIGCAAVKPAACTCDPCTCKPVCTCGKEKCACKPCACKPVCTCGKSACKAASACACDPCECNPCGCKAQPPRPASPSLKPPRLAYRLGIARYSLHKKTLDQALAMMQNMDCHYMGLMEGTIAYDATDKEIAAYKAKCAASGVTVVSAGPLYFSTREQLEACCKFAKRYGMTYVSVVPFEWNPKIAACKTDDERRKILPEAREWRLESDKMMDALDECVKKYNLRAAVHNHGPDNAYLYPTAEAAMKRIGNRDRRIGVCLDVGHERRAGLDPVAFIRDHADRVVEVHLKNIKIDPVNNYAKEGPRGELDIPGILKGLADGGFTGYCLIEFEKDFTQNAMPLAESFGYYRGVMDAVPLKKAR